MSEFQTMTGPQPFKLSIADYELLQKSGAFDRCPRVELIEGVIVQMNSERSPHVRVKNEVTFRLHDALRDLNSELRALCEATIRLSDHSLPEPDAIVVSPVAELDEYIPGRDVGVVIEVAHSSKLNDLDYKFRLYGRHGLPEYWVFDLNEDEAHLFWEPTEDGYGRHETIAFGQRLDSRTIPGLSIDTAKLY